MGECFTVTVTMKRTRQRVRVARVVFKVMAKDAQRGKRIALRQMALAGWPPVAAVKVERS